MDELMQLVMLTPPRGALLTLPLLLLLERIGVITDITLCLNCRQVP